MPICEKCGKEIKGNYYDSIFGGGCYCEECGENILVYEDEYQAYIYEDDARDSYSDDYGVDIDRFDFIEIEKKYYVEIYDKSNGVVVLQSKWFKLKMAARNWFWRSIDYINFNDDYGVRLLSSIFKNGEQGDVEFEMHLK